MNEWYYCQHQYTRTVNCDDARGFKFSESCVMCPLSSSPFAFVASRPASCHDFFPGIWYYTLVNHDFFSTLLDSPPPHLYI